MGHSVLKVGEDTLQLDDGTTLKFVGNADCCMYYELERLADTENIITKVELTGDFEDKTGNGVFEIFVFTGEQRINLVRFEGSDGTGYYGTGYTIRVTRP